ncbi:FecR family protein [Achromobacter xylosoxidans]|nr:FecR domain-containing protein [Achromobacter xylosoxidans]MBC9903399.1 FecR domain-containing protein [Achromobacter xylosoxidans]MBD0867282.1 FecR domain-containing protein [Achromobacter xylosoxidans]QNP88308.1 FecR domain-containing protein [Achromobacter xylosoxidans]
MAAPKTGSAEEEASRWVVRHSGQGMDAQAQAEFEAWYRADASHADAYERLARLWRRMGEIDRGKLAPRRTRKRGAAAALAVLAAWPAWQLLRATHPGADYTTGAEVRRVALPDGSSATLDADSAIAIDFAPGKREVRLLAGRALFAAAPRAPGGPDFTVVTPDASAAALGTRYVVAREADGTRVAVYEHRVAVHCLVCQGDAVLVLDAGQEAAVSATGIARLATAQEPAPDWSQGLLAFNNVALPQAAARLSRYGDKHILVLGDTARRLHVSGTAGIGDPKRALELLLAQTKVGITELPGLLILR